MYKLSLDLLDANDVLQDLKIVREGIVDEESYQHSDSGLVMSSLDDIISMCEYAIEHGYKKQPNNTQ